MSYRKILAVVTEQTASTVIARYAISLAAACRAELVLYAAQDEGSNGTVLLHTKRHLDHLFAVALELDIPVTRIAEVGNIGKLLPVRARAEQADLVFYPLTPQERYGALLQLDTVHRLLRSVGSDLSIMRVVTMAKPHPRHILTPLGATVVGRDRRLLFITALAQSFHSQVTLFHLHLKPGVRGMPDYITEFRKHLQRQQIAVLERSGKGAIGQSIRVEAIARHSDLIVLGASERGMLRRLLFGNPAGEVLHQPPCNVILFRAGR